MLPGSRGSRPESMLDGLLGDFIGDPPSLSLRSPASKDLLFSRLVGGLDWRRAALLKASARPDTGLPLMPSDRLEVFLGNGEKSS